MNYEIDFLPVGNGDKSGDAICLRWEENNAYKVMVIDGGTKESGEKIVAHIKEHYNTTKIDYVVNTHPDQDHASGLSIVLENLEIGELWIHRPWNYTKQIIDYFQDGRITEESLKRRLEKSFSYSKPLEDIANDKKITIKEPFQGKMIGIFEILSPSKQWYLYDLIPDFSKTPDKKEGMITEGFESLKEKVLAWIEESFDKETLKIDGTTSADNESSVILYTKIDDKGILFTGDAGSRALNKAYAFKEEISKDLNFIQVPHHGSRNNVNPDILDKILGNKGQEYNKTAVVSASETSTKHPRQSVINAFIRRGCEVTPTNGLVILFSSGNITREGWGKVEPLEFQKKFQE